MSESREQYVVGVDSVPVANGGGWVMALTGIGNQWPVKFVAWPTFDALWAHACKQRYLVVAVDIPIGLTATGCRDADQEARNRLRAPSKGLPGRASSVFHAPPLCALHIKKYMKAKKLSKRKAGRGLSRQAHALRMKIGEVRRALESHDFNHSAVPRAAEVHPEVSFAAMAQRPMRFHKSRQAGVVERLAVLRAHFPNIVDAALFTEVDGPPDPGLDDVLDAAAAAWTARRLVSDDGTRLGGTDLDETDYPMNIWV